MGPSSPLGRGWPGPWARRAAWPAALLALGFATLPAVVFGCNSITGLDQYVLGSECPACAFDAGPDEGGDAFEAGPGLDASDAGDAADAPETSPPPPPLSVYPSWPMPNAADAGVTDHLMAYDAGASLVYDAVTKLTWLKDLASTTGPEGGTVGGCLAGYRPATRIEAVSLLDPSRSPAIDTDVFSSTVGIDAGGTLWTSSFVDDAGAGADFYFVDLATASVRRVSSHLTPAQPWVVACVRVP